jgi:class 3 adenylate cyclase
VKRSEEIEAVVRRFLDARIDLDVDAMRALHSSSDFVRQIGSDRNEWSQGLAEAVKIWSGGQEGWHVEEARLLRIEAFEHGEIGWAAVEQERTLVSGQVFVFRITMVFVLETYAWKLIQIHFSIPVKNEDVVGVELTGTLSNLLGSMDSEGDAAAIANAAVGTVTVMFTDVVGSTALSQSMGDQSWTALIRAHFDSVQRIVESQGGSVIKTAGDGGMYVFTSATNAMRAAADIQHSLMRSTGHELVLRVGISTGDVIQTEDDYLGLTVNKAARVAAAADGGQVLVSVSTISMVNAAEFVLGDPIIAELKGISGTHELRPLLWNQT